MGVFTKAKPPVVNRKRTLRSVPLLREGATLEPLGDGKVMLRVPVPRGVAFFDRFRPAVSEHRHELDELGAFVVEQMNGVASVEQISESLAKRFRLNQREAELSTVAFIKMLADRRVIVAIEAIPEASDADPSRDDEEAA